MYQTGTVASPTALKSVIETFCIGNGWSLSAQDYLSKGLSNVKFTVSGTSSAEILNVNAANSSDGTVTACPFGYAINIPEASWPATYHLFANTSPDLIVCVLNFDITAIQPIIFGDIVKIHTSAFVGGNFFFAPRTEAVPTVESYLWPLSDTELGIHPGGGASTSGGSPIPFATDTVWLATVSGIHAEIDTSVWDTVQAALYTPKVTLAPNSVSALYRSPNSWNNQAVLVPFHLVFAMASSLYSYLGYIEHLRLVRVDNYEIGDIITLGTDKWKVFPWLRKNTLARNGGTSGTKHTGTVGFAVRYDGP